MGERFDVQAVRGMGAAATAALLHLGAIRPDAGPGLALVALVPLLAAARWDAQAAVDGVEPHRGGISRRALATGAIYGLVLTVGSIYWAVPLLPVVYGFGLAKTLAVTVAFTAIAATGSTLFYVAMVRAAYVGWPPAVTCGPFLVCLELLYPRMPPEYLGASLGSATWWVQMADLGGPLLLTLWVGAVDGLIFEVGLAWHRRTLAPRRLLGLALLLALPALYGAHRVRTVEEAMAALPTHRVGLVQPNRPMYVEVGQVEPLFEALRAGTRRALARGPLDLIVWPEGAPPTLVPRDLATLPPSWLPEGLGGASLLFGASTRVPGESGGLRSNSAFLADPSGHIVGRYDKNLLFPFGEYVPLGDRFPGLYDLLHVERLRPGTASPLLVEGPLRLGVLICYEDILPAFVRERVIPAHPNLLVNLTNDGWFFESPGAAIHMRLARLRAVEHHRFLLRATNHGVTAVVDPVGRVVQEAPPFEPAVLVSDVALLEGDSLYARLGDWPGWVALLCAPWMLLGVRRRPQVV